MGDVAPPEDEAGDDLPGLEEAAARIEAEEPGTEVRVNPEGCAKISEMLLQLAEPWTDGDSDLQEQRAVINAAALAWNYRLSDPQKQRRMREQLAGLFDGVHMLEMIDSLVARAEELFPDEDRHILKVEVEPDRKGDLAVRVISTLPGAGELAQP